MFYAKEIEFRRMMWYPPFGAMANVVVRAAREEDALTRSGALGRLLQPAPEGVKVLGPAPAAVARLKNEYRFQMLLKDLQPRAPERDSGRSAAVLPPPNTGRRRPC